MTEVLLEATGERIQKAYDEIGHQRGWSFLYTPGRTLNEKARFLFMGLNPGGKGGPDSFCLTTEGGNAYHHEVENDWLGNGKPSPLQLQVIAFYEMLSSRQSADVRTLMDATLAANFCPFRSPTWRELHEPDRSLTFCYELWADLLGRTDITTIVTMSSLVRQYMTVILNAAGAVQTESLEKPSGWGTIKYHIQRFVLGERAIVMVSVPHLSRYRIFNRAASDEATTDIADTVAASLAGWRLEG